MQQFFENRNLTTIVDAIAQRYNKTPYEVMCNMTIYEFCFNAAMLVVGRIEENKVNNPKVAPTSSNKRNWSKMGIERKIVKKGSE